MKKYLILAAAVTMFAACTNDTAPGQDGPQNERIPLTIGVSNANISATTRSAYTNIQRDTLNSNTAIGLFIIGQGTTANTHNVTAIAATPQSYEVINYKLGTPSYFVDTDKYGRLTSTTEADGSTAATLYYPDNKSEQIGLFAYAPHTTLTATDAVTHTTSFASAPAAGTDLNTSLLTVQPLLDQTKDIDYVLSDVLWGTQGYSSTTSTYDITAANYLLAKAGTAKDGFYTGTVGTKGEVILPMKHALAKVTVNLIPGGMDISKLKGATVKVYVDHVSGTMNLATGAVTAATPALASAQAVTLTSCLGQVNDVNTAEIASGTDGHPSSISYNSSSYAAYSASAVIIPQKVYDGAASEAAFIEITLSGNTASYVWKAKNIDMTTASREYIFNIMVTASGLNVVTTVANWTSGGAATEGGAVLQ